MIKDVGSIFQAISQFSHTVWWSATGSENNIVGLCLPQTVYATTLYNWLVRGVFALSVSIHQKALQDCWTFEMSCII